MQKRDLTILRGTRTEGGEKLSFKENLLELSTRNVNPATSPREAQPLSLLLTLIPEQ